jgi:hypothetical protein
VQDVPEPPADADDWSDEQWIDWLKATDAPEEPADQSTPVTTGSRVAQSAGGRILGDAMIGLARALYGPPKQKPAIVVESGEPGDDQLELYLDFDHPDQSYVVVEKDADAPER